MGIVLAFLLGLALAGTASAKPIDSDPVTLITAIYKTYETDKAGLPHVYSKRLQALIDKDDKETPEGMVGRIDWDVFIDGQDWKLTDLKITPVSQTATQAKVRATFKNFDRPSDMLFDLVLEDGRWRIDDITKTLKPRWTMSKILTDAPDAFPDAEPDKKWRRLLRLLPTGHVLEIGDNEANLAVAEIIGRKGRHGLSRPGAASGCGSDRASPAASGIRSGFTAD